MTRFCKQRDDFSCGPIALLNIDKFFGQRVTYKDLPVYQLRTGCKRSHGTYTRDISRILGRAKRKTWKKAKQFLKDGGCIMVQNIDIGHYYLIIVNYHGDIGVVNYFWKDCCAVHISSQRASRWLKDAFRTWYVSKPTRERKRQ